MHMHEKTVDWLKAESVKYIRKFQLANTKADRMAAEKKLKEIRARLHIEAGFIGKIIDENL